MRAVLFVIGAALAACATSSGSNGNGGIDAAGTGGDDDDGGSTIDAPVGGPIDAASSDAAPLDANPGAPDAGTTCPTSPCDLVEQCGCNDTQACDIDGSDLTGTACRGITTPGNEGDTCTLASQCDAGYVCVGSGSNLSCERYCASDTDCLSPRGQCVIQLTNGGTPIDGAVTCSSNCDPVAASNPLCPAGWSCDLFTATYQTIDHDIVDCRVTGAATQGQSCTSTACAAGLSCVNNGTSDVCGKICRRPAGTECTSGTTCYGFQTPFTVGGQEYGVCL